MYMYSIITTSPKRIPQAPPSGVRVEATGGTVARGQPGGGRGREAPPAVYSRTTPRSPPQGRTSTRGRSSRDPTRRMKLGHPRLGTGRPEHAPETTLSRRSAF